MKFLIKVFNFNSIKTLFKIANNIHKKNKKNIISIVFDMLKCSFKYQASFHDYQEFEFYILRNSERKTFLTRGKNNKIVATFNNKDYFHFLDNKLEFNEKFKKFLNRKTLDLNKTTLKEFKEFTYDKENIIIKPVNGEGGKGIELLSLRGINDEELFNDLINKNKMLVEEVIKQHDSLNKLYSKSVNSLRIFTFYKNNKVYFLQAILKIGNGSFVDNFSSGGMYTFVDENGIVKTPAIDINDNIFRNHPITNERILGFQVPFIKESIEMVKEASLLIPEIAYIGWDVAITNDGPSLIEGNSYPGIFQIKPSLGYKTGLVPKYEEIMGIDLE